MIGKYSKKVAILITTLIVISLWAGSIMTYASDDDVTLEVDSTSMQMGVSGNLTLSIHSKMNVDEIGIEGIGDFDMISTSQSTSTQFINGKSAYEKQYLISIMPKEVGTFYLKAIVNDGKVIHESGTITITVNERDQSLDGTKEDVFIKTVVSSEATFLGEKTVLTYEIYSQYNLDRYGFLEEVSLDGFVSDRVSDDLLKTNYVTIDGTQYVMHEAAKWILTPIQAGNYEIASYNFQANLSTSGYLSSSEPRYLQTEPVNLDVKKLPSDNKPADFSGIVGKLSVDVAYDKNEVDYSEPITLSMTMTGNGGLENLGKLYDQKQKGFSIYETNQAIEKAFVGNEYLETKHYDVIFVPSEEGQLTIEPLSVSYFNTDTGMYDRLEITGVDVQVNGSINKPNDSNSTNDISNGSVNINQISYKNQEDGYFNIRINKQIFIIVAFIILMILVCFIGIKYWLNRKPNTLQKRYVKLLNKAGNINELNRLFYEFIFEITGESIYANTHKELLNKISSQDTANYVEELTHYFEYGKFHEEKNLDQVKSIFKQMITSYDG